MLWSKAMRYPALTMGIIMFAIYISDAKTQTWWQKTKRRFIPSTCDSLLARMNDKAPKQWEMSCPGTEKLVLKYKLKELNKDRKETKAIMYKQIVNILVTFSQMANPETLNYLKQFRVIIKADFVSILAKTDGEAMVAFRKMKNKDEIAKHVKLSVKVKEQFH
ncbi:MAG: hypothetical protein N4A33_05570 [Bacteriovoracaceae bacterium]|jgi:hypothetical protein|nr:hypothetical protein [Bacteriovoracaceae bacterium]